MPGGVRKKHYKLYLHHESNIKVPKTTQHRITKNASLPENEESNQPNEVGNDDLMDFENQSICSFEAQQEESENWFDFRSECDEISTDLEDGPNSSISTQSEAGDYELPEQEIPESESPENSIIDEHISEDEQSESYEDESGSMINIELDNEVNESNDSFMKDFQTMISPSSSFTAFEILLMVMHFGMRHSLTNVAILDLLKMINLIMGNSIPDSLYYFNKVFSSSTKPIYHYYCENCMYYIGKKEDILSTDFCCPVCNYTSELSSGSNNFFLTIPVTDQLKEALETPTIQNNLNYKMSRNKDDNILRDIFDGEIYKNLEEEGWHEQNNITLTFNTDGSPVFKSVKSSMWPIQFRINELPPEIRYKSDNSFIAGLWFGKKEPKMTTFLTPLVDEAKHLETYGLSWIKNSNQTILSKVGIIGCVVDSVAKPMVQCMKQFNGTFGCPYCKHSGNVVDTNQIRYKYMENIETRTDENIRSDMVKAHNSGKPINGLKGVSPLYPLNSFNLVHGFPIDYMHACLLGVTRMLASLWIDSSNHQREFYINKTKVAEIDNRILKIKPPSNVTRRPRPFSDQVHWKANEWRNWLLFYSLPCLSNVLPDKYLQHFCVFVTAMFILLKEEIHRAEVDHANTLLNHFVARFEHLYGEIHMTFNVHLLTHLGKTVSAWGPLWGYSAFSFESGNGTLVQLVKGTRGVATQVTNKYLMYKSIQKVVQDYIIQPEVLTFCETIMSYTKTKTYCQCNDVTVLGQPINVPLTENEKEAFDEVGYPFTEKTFLRFVYNGQVYHSKHYTRPQKSNDTVVRLKSGGYGVIERVLKIEAEEGADDSFVILIRKVLVTSSHIVRDRVSGARAEHIKMCPSYVFGNLFFTYANNICSKCFMVEANGSIFITDFPNLIESD